LVVTARKTTEYSLLFVLSRISPMYIAFSTKVRKGPVKVDLS